MEYPRISYWHETADNKMKPTCDNKNLDGKNYDILIIGAGLTGLTTAYLLKDAGYKICVIEGSKIGYGTTGYSTSKMTVQHDLIYDYLIKNFSFDEARQYYKANNEGIKLLKKIIADNNIECDLKEQTAYVYTTVKEELGQLKDELEAYEQLSIDGFYTEDVPLPFKALGAVGIRNQAQFNPIKFLYSLYNILLESSCEIYEGVRALDINPACKGHKIHTDCGDITAGKVIVSSHYPFDNDFGLYFLRLYQDKSYIIAAKTDSAPFEGMYINVNDPIYSMRYHFSNSENILLLSGANHRTGVKDNEEECYEELEKFLKEHFGKYEIISKWSAQDCMTYDNIPYIGSYSNNIDNLYVATGFKKWGISHSAAAALILRNKVLEISDDYSEIFNPSRITPILSLKEFFPSVGHIVSGFMKRIKPAPDDLFETEAGVGRIVEYNGRKVGVYKDENGDYFCINPVCTHLKCSVSFNEAEKSWDCQCHGSRFDIKGNILEGPAVYPLEKIKIKKPNS
jgi:glycine/D-amino acid oxidase-like deaminating enzyme/nitrite reductase/ring-hydroxylating ferredoxin subunit